VRLLHNSGNFRYSGANGTKFSENEFYGLKIGAIHRNRFAARVLELLEMAALPDLSAAIEPLLRVREDMCTVVQHRNGTPSKLDLTL